MSKRSIFLVAVTLLALVAVAKSTAVAGAKKDVVVPAAPVKTVQHLPNGQTRTRVVVPRSLPFAAPQHEKKSKGLVGAPPTDPPFEQAHAMLFYFSDWCQESLQLVPGQTMMFNGGWSVAPPTFAWSQWSGEIVEGFEAKGVPGNDYINGTAFYQASTAGINYVQMAFAAVQGEWVLETVSPTVWGIEIMGGEVGNIAMYNIVVGQSHATTPSC